MIGAILRIRYEITGLQSEGPIFTAYTARDRLLARDVTIRTLRSPFDTETAFVEAIERVIEKTKRVQHPGIEVLQNVDDHEGKPFVVSELTRGVSLQDRIRKLAPFSVQVAIGAVISALEGLDAIHQAGMVHGDVSPTNIAIQQDGSARLQMTGIWESYGASPTAGAEVLPFMAPYLAPEISAGNMPTPASDVYATGIILFQLLTARLPYPADTPFAVAIKHASDPVPSLRALNPSIPMVLDELLKKAIAKRPSERYRDAGEMLSDLRILQDALRFGKNLTWPISGASASRVARPAAPTKNPPRSESQPVQERPATRKLRDEERFEPDVPIWLRLLGWLSLLAFFGFFVAFGIYNLDRPKQVKVPNLRNMSLTEATDTINSVGLTKGVITRVPNEQVMRDRVLDQNPKAGSTAIERGSVSLRVSAGSRFAEVPDLIGHTVDEARTMLDDLGLTMDNKFEEESSSTIERGKIIGQNPEKKAKVERDSVVRVKLSSGPPPNSGNDTATPDAVGPFVYNLNLTLDDLKRRATVRVEMTDDYGTVPIFGPEVKNPNDVISLKHEGHGKQAIFKVYYDDELVESKVVKASDLPRAKPQSPPVTVPPPAEDTGALPPDPNGA